MFKLDLEKAEEPEIKLPTSAGIIEKTIEFQKNIYFCFIDYAKAFDCVDHNKLWKIQQWPQDWKRSVFIPIPKKGNAKECSDYHTIACISHASKVMLKILQVKLQQYITVNFHMFKLVLEKAEEQETKLLTSVGSSKMQESSRKTSISALLTMPKPLTVWITRNCGEF